MAWAQSKEEALRFADDNHTYIWDRSSSFVPQSTLFHAIDLSTFELLSANLSYSDKNSIQKLVVLPFRFTNEMKRFKWLVNTKVNLALAGGITTVGIGFGGDNSLFYTRRAQRILAGVFTDNAIKTPDGPGIDNSLTAKMVDILAKITDQQSALELKKLFEKQRKADLLNQMDIKTASLDKILDSLLLVYDKALAQNVVKWTIGYNTQFFSNLFSKGTVSGFDSLNHYNIKSHNLSASLVYSHENNCLVIAGTYNQIWARNTAVTGQLMVPYFGPAVNVSYRLCQFISQQRLDTMADYKKSLFVPSLNIGVSYEGQYADAAPKYKDYYQNGAQQVVVWTPYVDILISPAIQFRIAIPLTKTTYAANAKTFSTGANVQYNFNLSNLSK